MKWRIRNVNEISKNDRESALLSLSHAKRARLDKLKSESRRDVSLSAAVNLLSLLRDEYGVESAVLSAKENGAPFIEGCDLFVSISHSGDYVAAAVSENPIGIDVEKIRDFDKKLVDRICTPRERDYVLAKDTALRFFEVWTGKEAHFKAYGGSFKDFDVFDTVRECFVKDGYFVTIVNNYTIDYRQSI